jgi:hypothetical protein
MYPAAHIVVASGAAWCAELVARRSLGSPEAESGAVFDYRLVAAGSWLPDAIDKPLAWFILRGIVEDNHLLGHTLVFGLALAAPALFLAWQGHAALLSVASGVLMHRLCDPMWPEMETVLWPLYGLEFQHWTGGPGFVYYLLPEIIAVAVLLAVLRHNWRRDELYGLICRGKI